MTAVTAPAAPYRATETPLTTRERIIEQDLAHAREMLDAFSNEEVRIERRFLAGDVPREELALVRNTLHEWEIEVARLTCELERVRQDIIGRGERKKVPPRGADEERKWFAFVITGALAVMTLVGGIRLPWLRSIDTAQVAPQGTTYGWGGPLDPGQSWLYVEAPPGVRFEVDGRGFIAPNSVPISALHSHDVAFEGGGKVVVRWIPCTTAVVRTTRGSEDPSVERFYNSSTCF